MAHEHWFPNIMWALANIKRIPSILSSVTVTCTGLYKHSWWLGIVYTVV